MGAGMWYPERAYESLVIPGLLQTEKYATKVMSLYRIHLKSEMVRARTEIRMKRQQFLMERDNPSSLARPRSLG
jgi:hypothetical protein